MKKRRIILLWLFAGMLLVPGCTLKNAEASSENQSDTATNSEEQTVNDISEMFTDRDKEIGYDEEDSALITLADNGTLCDSDAVQISENTVTITEEGTYILSGTLSNGMIIVDAEDTDKIQIVLNGVEITSAQSAAIYVRSADKVFLTTASGSDNILTNGGTYTTIDDNNIDAVIFSKDDLTLNGAGTLRIKAGAGHGVVSKDDLVLTSGTYDITAASHGLSGKDSVRILSGTFTITSGKDGIHASNTDDSSLGFVYLADGSFKITAQDDGIHADSSTTILGGEIEIAQSYEGIEGLSIDITGGNISVTASDDGLNAAGGNDSSGFEGAGGDQFAATEGAYIHISGGVMHVNAEGDGIDSNGDLTVSGGETYISGPVNDGNSALDYNGEAVISGGTFVAAGSSGMAQNFGSSSTQGTVLVSVGSQEAGSVVSLQDSDGIELMQWEPDKVYTSVLISCPELTKDSTYTVSAGTYSEEITLDTLIYGSGQMQGGPGNPEQREMKGTPPDMSEGNKQGTPPDRNGENKQGGPGEAGENQGSSSDTGDSM